MTESTSLSPQHSLLRAQLHQLSDAMRSAALWSAHAPSEEAMASTMPFMYDTLKLEEWLQWVFIPRLHALVDGGHALPSSCSVHPLAEHEWTQRGVSGHQAALQLLADIDANLTKDSPAQ